ncbi:hypothetical protein [Faecalibaculum rodentium]|uniref:Uncharacterized protein n=1 Tax=Faecalibaculum rodentium TaxID=1702221 RepID=A0A140DSM6_9FIRM|nr:hypothetical protein [Faecalibaculum rodentium]AMK53653.1 hypothetical protein AALO17_05190 [Faecalibaculum rodentium]
MTLSAGGMGLVAGLVIALVLGGFWAWFVRSKKPNETVTIIGWGLVMALVLCAFFFDLYLPE